MNNADRGKPISLRPSAGLEARLDAMVAKYPLLNKHKVALAAMERGLDAMELDPRWFEKTGNAK